MKKKLTILVIVGMALSAVMLVLYFSDPPPSAVQLVFLGYTNTAVGEEAVFSVRCPSGFGGCGWRDPVVSRKEGSLWKTWSTTNPPLPKMRFFNGPIRRSTDVAEPKAEVFVAFRVETTNEISRIVVQVDENPPRASRTEWAMRRLWGWIGMNPTTPTGRSYFITNETTIKPAA